MMYVNFISEKICNRCGILKNINNFGTTKDHKGDLVFRNICKICKKQDEKTWHQNNNDRRRELANTPERKTKKAAQDKKYRQNNLNKIQNKKKKYYQENKEEICAKNTEYQRNNRSIRNTREKERKQKDPIYKLKTLVSSRISSALKNVGSSKRRTTFIKYVSYTIQELKEHLEKQFEPWMNWTNWGRYNSKTWDNHDQSTWTWQLDHIIPRSDLPYITMTEENFQRCWALDNLRPLSAKQNIIEGAYKTRHNHPNRI